jgi:hypothetical protein
MKKYLIGAVLLSFLVALLGDEAVLNIPALYLYGPAIIWVAYGILAIRRRMIKQPPISAPIP